MRKRQRPRPLRRTQSQRKPNKDGRVRIGLGGLYLNGLLSVSAECVLAFKAKKRLDRDCAVKFEVLV